MPKEEYVKLIDNVSIAFFHTKRQCGLYNIHSLILRSAKVFLSEEGVMYDYFIEQGIPVEKIEDVSKMKFEDFISSPVIADIEKHNAYIEEIIEHKKGMQHLRSMYYELENGHRK